MLIEIIKFLIYSSLIVIISKYILVKTLRNLGESLKLKSRTIGNIAGYATSMPEFLTITVSSFNGLVTANVFNILSSNIINLLQYTFATIKNKNFKLLKNKVLILDIVLVIITICIPIILITFNIEMNIVIVPIFLILYFLFRYFNNKAHNSYLKLEDKKVEEKNETEDKLKNENKMENEEKKSNKLIIAKYISYLLIAGILLFFIGNALGNVLENLCVRFGVAESIIGILLGFITSIPELITFFESQKHHSKSENKMLGVVESTNNLLTSNMVNLFIIQSIGILIILFVT